MYKQEKKNAPNEGQTALSPLISLELVEIMIRECTVNIIISHYTTQDKRKRGGDVMRRPDTFSLHFHLLLP